jgi:hypothetical protein
LSQRAPRIGGVALELYDERVGRAKTHGVTQALNELDGDVRAIPIALGLEEVDLERQCAITERGTWTEIHHSAKTTTRRPYQDGVYTGWREKFARRRECDIERRESKQPSATIALSDAAGEGVPPAQESSSILQLAVRNGSSYRAGRDGNARRGNSLDDSDGKVARSTQLAKQLYPTLACTTQAVVMADQELAHAISVQQDVLDEVSGAVRGKRRREAQHDHVAQSRFREHLQLLDSRRQQQWRGWRIDDFERMGLEGDEQAWQTALRRPLNQPSQQVTVADVHTIERTYCGD